MVEELMRIQLSNKSASPAFILFGLFSTKPSSSWGERSHT